MTDKTIPPLFYPGTRVMLWGRGQWKHKRCGVVIGSYDGLVGVLLATGEYIDVPGKMLRAL